MIAYARRYIPDLVGWLTKFGQVAAYYDANGHYARVQPVFGPTASTGRHYRLVGVSPSDRLNPFSRDSRPDCPGGATQPTPDGRRPGPSGAATRRTSPPRTRRG